MSADGSQGTVADCLRLGAEDFFVKPVRQAQARSLTNYMRKPNKRPIEE